MRRRDFLKTACLASAALAVPAWVVSREHIFTRLTRALYAHPHPGRATLFVGECAYREYEDALPPGRQLASHGDVCHDEILFRGRPMMLHPGYAPDRITVTTAGSS